MRNFALKILRTATGTILSGFIASCGEPVKSTTCAVTLKEDTRTLEGSSLRVVLRGSFTSDCEKVYSDNNADSQMKLTSEVKTPTADVYLGELAAGERKYAFTKDNSTFALASVSTTIRSSLVTQWRFPWMDKPGTVSLAVIAPKDALPDQIPQAARLELSL